MLQTLILYVAHVDDAHVDDAHVDDARVDDAHVDDAHVNVCMSFIIIRYVVSITCIYMVRSMSKYGLAYD